MTALAPAWLGLLALVGVVAVLHLVRPRPRAVRTSTLPFFLGLDRRQAENPWLRLLKRLLALLLSAAVVVCATAAVAQVVIGGGGDGVRGVVVLFDRSASLAAGERMVRLHAALAARLAALPADVPVTLLAYDARPQLVVPRTTARQAVRSALAGLVARPVAGESGPALALARRLAAADAPAAVWHATDSPAPTSEADGVRLETICVPAAELVNAGITAAGLRTLPQERNRHAAFVQVEGLAPGPLTAELEVALDGRVIEVRRLELKPGQAERLSIPIESRDGRLLRLTLRAAGDALAADDLVELPIPPPRTLRVVHVSPRHDPFVALALAACAGDGDVEVRTLAPDAWDGSGADLAVLDGWVPPTVPTMAAILIDPPAGLPGLPLRRLEGDGLPIEAPRVLDGDHALLVGIANRRVALTQTASIDTDAGLEPLWASDAGVLLAAARRGGHRLVVMAFAPGRSERLPLSAAFPLLIANAMAWSTADESSAAVAVLRTGTLVDVRGALAWDGSVPADGPLRPIELDRCGSWRDAAGRQGAAALLSRSETLLPPGDAQAAPLAALAAVDGDLVVAALWLLLAVLLLESWLFHRKGVS